MFSEALAAYRQEENNQENRQKQREFCNELYAKVHSLFVQWFAVYYELSLTHRHSDYITIKNSKGNIQKDIK